jgi:two-component system, chemotaxis family, sensor kinase CheA
MKNKAEDELELTEEILKEFFNESEELLLKAESSLLAMETKPMDKEELNRVFRSFHTIKGTADYLGFKALKELAHFCEGILDTARGSSRQIEKNVLSWLIKAVDEVKFIMESCLSGKVPFDREKFENMSGVLMEKLRTGMLNGINDSKTAGDFGVAMDLSGTNTADLRPSLKIDSYKFNSMMNSLNELAVAETSIRRELRALSASGAAGLDGLKKKIGMLGKITAKIGYDSSAMKMLPFQHLFNKMTRLIRDLSIKSGKKLKLFLNGGDTEIDREIIENLSEPLIHILRNSVDHGIENAGERNKRGKPEEGMLSLSAFCRDGNIIVSVSDDGCGLDRDKILKKARLSGLIGQTEEISDEKAHELIMMPGFSTAEKVSELSGRGVGMDVVRKTVETLRGQMKIKSIKGQGTKITMTFPVNMAVIDGLIIQCCGEIFVIPVSNVTSVITSKGVDAPIMAEISGGKLCPEPRKSAPAEPEEYGDARPRESIIVNIERKGKVKMLSAQKIISQQRIAVKNIPGLKLEKTFFSGAVILSDGKPALIISPERLMKTST